MLREREPLRTNELPSQGDGILSALDAINLLFLTKSRLSIPKLQA